MIHNSHNRIAVLLGLALSGATGAGMAAIQAVTGVPDLGAIMAMPHSSGWRGIRHNGGNGRGAAARSKRAARTRRNIRARAAK
jgi:hypothetical protein